MNPAVRSIWLGAACGITTLLVACDNKGTVGQIDAGGDPDPATLCLTDSCGSKTRLVEIPGGENILFTTDGRLFVSGSENVYEISRDGSGSWLATPRVDGSGNFGGLAQIGDVLYVNGFDGQLYAAQLTAQPQFVPIHELGLGSPNGLVAGPGGELYIVNGPIPTNGLPDPKIVRLRLNPANPMQVVEQSDWFVTGTASFPNGIQRRGSTLIFSDASVLPPQPGLVRSVDIQPDGSAGNPQTLASFSSIPDDLGLVGTAVLVTYCATGQIALFDSAGGLLGQSAPLSFENPSSVRLGRPPLFLPGDLLVTEKGIVGLPPTPGYGSRLSVFRRNP